MGYDLRVTLERIIDDLEHVRNRPMMYITSRDPRAAESFLLGFSLGLGVFGFKDWSDGEVEKERGYGVEPTGLLPQIERRGLDKAAVVNELFEIEIEGYRRRLRKLMEGEAQPRGEDIATDERG